MEILEMTVSKHSYIRELAVLVNPHDIFVDFSISTDNKGVFIYENNKIEFEISGQFFGGVDFSINFKQVSPEMKSALINNHKGFQQACEFFDLNPFLTSTEEIDLLSFCYRNNSLQNMIVRFKSHCFKAVTCTSSQDRLVVSIDSQMRQISSVADKIEVYNSFLFKIFSHNNHTSKKIQGVFFPSIKQYMIENNISPIALQTEHISVVEFLEI